MYCHSCQLGHQTAHPCSDILPPLPQAIVNSYRCPNDGHSQHRQQTQDTQHRHGTQTQFIREVHPNTPREHGRPSLPVDQATQKRSWPRAIHFKIPSFDPAMAMVVWAGMGKGRRVFDFARFHRQSEEDTGEHLHELRKAQSRYCESYSVPSCLPSSLTTSSRISRTQTLPRRSDTSGILKNACIRFGLTVKPKWSARRTK